MVGNSSLRAGPNSTDYLDVDVDAVRAVIDPDYASFRSAACDVVVVVGAYAADNSSAGPAGSVVGVDLGAKALESYLQAAGR